MRLVHRISGAALAAALLAFPAAAQTEPDLPWSAEGRIEDGDSRDQDAHLYDDHPIRFEAGRRYRLSAASDDFDTLIRLYRAGESEPVAENDDFEGLDSRIVYTPEEGGNHVLRVLSFSADGRGAYSASVEALPPLPRPISSEPSSTGASRWQVWQGELTASDPDREGQRFDDYVVSFRAGQTHLISVEAEDFDTMVWVLRIDNREGDPIDLDDDAGPGLNALLGFQADETGDYIVRVTSYGTGGTGAYRLRISDALSPPPPVAPVAPAEASES